MFDKAAFREKPDPFEQEHIDDIFKEVWQKKTKHPYVQSQVQDAQAIETETQAINDELAQLKQEFDKVNDAATKQENSLTSLIWLMTF